MNTYMNVFSKTNVRNLILALIHSNESLSKFDLCKMTGLSTTAITSYVEQMLDAGMIYKKGPGASSGGRKPIMLSLKENFGYMIGIEFSAGGIYTCVLSFSKQKIYSNNTPLIDSAVDKVVSQLYQEIYQAIDKTGIIPEKILGIGVGIPGYSDYENGIIHVYTQLNDWENIDLKQLIAKEFKYPLFFTGSINSMAHAYKSVYKRGFCEDTIILGIRSGMKASAIINNSIIKGKHNFFGEIGHIKVVGSNRICRCGKKGCYDTEVSYIGLCMKVEEGIRVGKFNNISNKLKQTGSSPNIDMIIETCNEGDEELIQLLDDIIKELTSVICWILSMFDPSELLLVSKLNNYIDFIPKLKQSVYQSENRYQHNIVIEPSPYGNETGAIGCAAFVTDSLFSF